MNTLIEKYVASCTFPGVLDEAAVESALKKYCNALGVKRRVVRLTRNYTFEQFPELKIWALEIASAASDARAASAARDARDGEKALYRFAEWCTFKVGYWWYADLSWMCLDFIGANQLNKPDVIKWSKHCYNAYLAGAWTLIWTSDVLYWVAKPRVYVDIMPGGQRRLHREDGPTLISDMGDLYFLQGALVNENAVLYPERLTAADADEEENAESRRIFIERMGPGKYLQEIGAKVVDVDVETAKKGAAPRTLLQDKRGEKWLVCTDGSTGRVYHLPVPVESTTCRQAHEALCCFDETLILAKS